EPERRYASVDLFAGDLRNWLDGLPVAARGDGAGYRLRKFVRRHRVTVLAAVAVAAALIAATATSLWQAHRADRERDAALRTRDFVLGMLSNVSPYRRSVGRSPTITSLVETSAPRVVAEFADEPQIRVPLLRSFAGVFLSLGRARDSVQYLEAALKGERELGAAPELIAETQLAIANGDYYLRRFDESDRITAAILADLAQRPDDVAHARLAYSAREIRILVRWVRGDFDGAAGAARELIEAMRARLGADDVETAAAENYLGFVLMDAADIGRETIDADALEKAGRLIEHFAGIDADKFPAGYPGNYGDANTIAGWLVAYGDGATAEALATRVLDLRNRIYFGQGFYPAFTRYMRGRARCLAGRFDEASADFDDALTVLADSGNVGYMYLSRVRLRQAQCQLAAGRNERAAATFELARRIAIEDGGANTPLVRAADFGLAAAARATPPASRTPARGAELDRVRDRLVALAERLAQPPASDGAH
ncbi:MAG TPA: hypothetical protein VF132_08860, partial [Rudaea sp.]